MKHKNITGLDALHETAYINATDPTNTLGALRFWYDTVNEKLKLRNAANSAWIDCTGDAPVISLAKYNGIFSLDAQNFADVLPLSDYFDNQAISNTKWTSFQSQLQTLIYEDGRAKFIVPPNAGRVNGFLQSLPAGDCTIITKISTDAPKADFTTIGLALFQDAIANPNTSDIIDFELMRNNTAKIGIARYSDWQTYTAAIGTDLTVDTNIVYLRAVRVGTTWTFSYSFDGKVWTAHATTIAEGSYFTPKEFGITIVNTGHTNENVFDIEFMFYRDFPNAPLPGGLVGVPQSSIVDKRIICVGDSLTQGDGVSLKNTFVNQLASLLSGVSIAHNGIVLSEDNGSKDWKVINKGYNDYTTQNVIDKLLPNVLLRRDTELIRDIVSLFIGTNDIVGGISAATIYANLSTLITDLQAEGFEVWISTIIDRDGYGGFDTVRGSLNTLITTNSAGADEVIDLYGNSNLQNAANTTYFQGDGVHTNATGNSVIASILNSHI